MTERSEQIQILYEIVTSLDTELDLQDMLGRCRIQIKSIWPGRELLF